MKMRKFILLVVLVAFQFGTAQEKNEENKKSNVDATFYIGVNAHIQDNLNLNSNLQASNVVLLDNSPAEFIFGFNVFGKKYSSDFVLDFLDS